MTYCAHCSEELPPNAAFCIYCSQPKAATGPTQRLAQGSPAYLVGGAGLPVLAGSVVIPRDMLAGSVAMGSVAYYSGSVSFAMLAGSIPIVNGMRTIWTDKYGWVYVPN